MRSALLLALLVGAGLAGNYFCVPLFFGADFLFGSLFVLLVLYFYGLGWGLAAAVVAHSYTIVLWGHPCGFINFVCEILFVGIFLHRGYRNLLAVDAVFWLLLGMPLVWLEYALIMHMGPTSAAFIMVKQGINGVFNAMLASLTIWLLALKKLSPSQKVSADISLQESLFNLLVMMVLFPSLLFTMLEARHEKQSLEDIVIAELQSTSANLQFHLDSWVRQQQQAVRNLARLAALSPMTPNPRLQHDTEVIKQAFPAFRALHVDNDQGYTIAFSPEVNEKGDSTIGQYLGDRAWFKEARSTGRLVVSELFQGRIAVFAPLIIMAAPIMRENQWRGTATAAVDLTMVQEMLKPYSQGRTTIITLTDSQDRVIASTSPSQVPMQVWARRSTGVMQHLRGRLYIWHPDNQPLPSMTRWQQSYYVQEADLGPGLPWKLTLEVPVAPLQRALYATYVKHLTIMAVLTALALLLSRGLTRPLAQLAKVTAHLPARLQGAQNLDWPASSMTEINTLVANAKSMARTLEDNFHRLQQQTHELQESAAKYRTLFESSAESFFLLKDTFLDCNAAAARLWHCDRRDIIGRSPLDFSPPVQPDGRASAAAARVFLDAALAGEPQFFGWQHRCQDGVLIWCEVSLQAVVVGGEPLLQAIVRDTTLRRQAEEERAKVAKLEAVGVLAGGIAHDFNNILMAIVGNLSLAEVASSRAETRARLAAAAAACGQAQSLARQFLTFAKGGTPVKTTADLQEIIVEAGRLALSGSQARLDFSWAAGLWPVEVDRGQVHQVLSNLFINADQAMPTGGVVQVQTENLEAGAASRLSLPAGQYVAVTVTDQGVGIAPEFLERIFDPYFTTKQKGSGLGLATAFSIVKQHGGQLTVDSRPGEGTTFRLYLPASEKAAAQEQPAASVPPPQGSGRILVMDDDPVVRKVVGHMLVSLGYEPVLVQDGREALAAYTQSLTGNGPIAAVILDITIPGGMGGREVMPRLLAVDAGIKALVSSGYASDATMADFRAHGFKGVIAKPYRLGELGRVLQEVLGG